MSSSLRPLFALALAVSTTAHAARYVVFDLGRRVDPHQIGRQGDIAGTNARKTYASGVEWRHGHWYRLEGAIEALAVNGHGDVAGYGNLAEAGDWPAIWPRQGPPLVLQFQGLEVQYGEATAIANDGSSAGWVRGAGFQCFHAGADGVATAMDFPGGGDCYVTGMNTQGQVIGYGSFGFVWRDGEFTDLGALPGTTGSAGGGINDRGEVVGACNPFGFESRAFYWKDGEMKALAASKDFVWTSASSINNHGVIVGYGSRDSKTNVALRFVVGRKAIDLNTETLNLQDWRLVVAESVNDDGAIVGIGYRADGIFHAFMLLPQR
jgi:probable HAF family extracellular repeat protein